MSFWDLLRPPVPTNAKGTPPASPLATAAALRQALAQAEASATEAEELAGAIAQERGDMLLSAPDAAIDEVDGRLRQAQRSADRGAAAVAALQEKLIQAEEAERLAGLDSVFAAGQSAMDRGLKIYRLYGDLAAELTDLVAELPIIAAEVDAANTHLAKAGDARRFSELDVHARPERSAIPLARAPFWRQLRLPAADHAYNLLWPPYRHIDIPEPVVRIPGEATDPTPIPRDTSIVA